MKKNIILLFSLVIISCNETDFCNYYNEFQEADFLMFKIIDRNNNQDLLFGDDRELDASNVSVRLKSDNGDYVSALFDFTETGQDSILLISLLDPHVSFPFSIQNELIISYDNQYLSDTIQIQYNIAGYCEDRPLLYDYNIILNNENICYLCFRNIIEIKK